MKAIKAVQCCIIYGEPPQSQVTMESPTTGMALAKLVITVAPQKLICSISTPCTSHPVFLVFFVFFVFLCFLHCKKQIVKKQVVKNKERNRPLHHAFLLSLILFSVPSIYSFLCFCVFIVFCVFYIVKNTKNNKNNKNIEKNKH